MKTSLSRLASKVVAMQAADVYLLILIRFDIIGPILFARVHYSLSTLQLNRCRGAAYGTTTFRATGSGSGFSTVSGTQSPYTLSVIVGCA